MKYAKKILASIFVFSLLFPYPAAAQLELETPSLPVSEAPAVTPPVPENAEESVLPAIDNPFVTEEQVTEESVGVDTAKAVPAEEPSAVTPAEEPTTMSLYPIGADETTQYSRSTFAYEKSSAKVDEGTGALIQNIPLDIPPGRNGLQPELMLSYNSQRTEDGIVGYGWTLSIPYIERLNKTGSQNVYATTTYFTASLHGELATTSTATSSPVSYRAKIDDGHLTAYSYATTTDTWTAYDREGTRYTYGSSNEGRQYATSTYKWMLQEIRDTNNNYVRYVYAKDSNQIYPTQLLYTGHDATDGVMSVTFSTSTRPDVLTSFKSGFNMTTNHRITQITASIDGAWVRKYALSYTAGNNGSRSLLSSIQLTGRDDDANELTMPPLTFAYVSTTTPFVAPSASTEYVKGPSFVVGDINGNARNDVTVFYMTSGGATSSQWFLDQTSQLGGPYTPPDYWASTSNGYNTRPYNERGVRFLDVNADGKADLVRGNANVGIYLNAYTHSSGTFDWQSAATSTANVPDFYEGSPQVPTGIFGDINGDGLPDYAQRVRSSAGQSALGMGLGWEAAPALTLVPPMEMPDSTGEPAYNSQLVDINSDGLDDWVYREASNTYVRLNTGTGWEATPDSRWTLATSTLYKDTGPYYDRGMRFMDINGDGLPDFVRSYKATYESSRTPEIADVKAVYLNTGSGWATSTAYTLSTYIMTALTGEEIKFNEYANWLGNGQQYQDVIETIGYPHGATSTVTYKMSASGGNPELPTSLLTVDRIVTTDGIGNSQIASYSYAGGKLYLPANIRDRKLGGFASSTVTLADSVTSTFYNQGDTVSTSIGEQTDGYAQAGRPFRVDISTPSGILLRRTFYRWDTASSTASSTSSHVYIAKTLEQEYDAVGAHKDKGREYVYSGDGDLIRSIEYGEVTGSSDGTFSDTGSDTRTSYFTYAASSSINLSVPTRKELATTTAATSTDELLYYDGLSYGQVGKGNQTRGERWVSASRYASTTKTYSVYGLVATSTDERGYSTGYTYDTRNFYVATTTNALSQQTGYTYNYANGKVQTTIDPNGRRVRHVFDALGRVKEIKQSDAAAPGDLVTRTTFTYVDSAATSSSILETNYLNAATSTYKYTYIDGLDRSIQDRFSTEESATSSVRDYIYNSAGRLASTSLPYFSTGTSRTTAISTIPLYTYTVFDALQRPTLIRNAVGSSTRSYSSWITTETDAIGNVKKYYTDAYDNLNRVDEINGASTYTTLYVYDSRNNLTKITDALSNVRNFSYDGLGRRTASEDLHTVGDGTYGTWSFAYDEAGNIASSTDPNGRVVERTYDALGRQLTEDYTGGAGTETTYTYDSCTNGIGYMCTASSTGAYVQNVYDSLGRVSIATTTIGGTAYATSYTYDRQGNITTLTYPDGSQVLTIFNTAMLPETESRKNAGESTWASVVRSTEYSPHYQVTSRVLATSATTTWTYNPAQLYRLSNIFAVSASSTSEAASGIMASSTLSSGLVSYWALDESSGVANDSHTNNNDLTNNNNTPFVSAKINNGADLESGSSQTFSISDASQSGLDITDDISIALWWKPESTGAEQYMASKFGLTSQYGYRLGYDGSGNVSFSVTSDCTGATMDNMYVSLGGVSVGTWYHIAVTWDASTHTATFYKNGSSLGTSVGVRTSICNSSAAFVLGSYDGGYAGQGVDGVIDEAGIWSRFLSANEVSALYASGSGLAYGSAGGESNLVLQNISYTYDAVGNITAISDDSGAVAAHDALYVYDSLNRLTTASITSASSTINQVFEYSELGNITRFASGISTSSGTISASSTLSSGLLAYWAFDEGSGNASDSSGNAKTLTNQNTVPYVSGKLANAADFERSSSQYFSRTNGGYFTPSSGTVSCWIRIESNPSVLTIMGNGTGSGTGGFDFRVDENQHLDMYFGADAVEVNGTTALSTATYYMATVTWDTLGKEVFLNGVSDGTSGIAESLNSGGSTHYVGIRGDINEGFDGLLDECGFWNRVLTPFEISSMYNSGNGLAYGSSAGRYTYAGTSYANPHAVTGIYDGTATTTYAYDNSGNLTTAGNWTYTWDYRNRLTQTATGTATTTYGYDHNSQRVSMVVGSTTTVYPSKYFSITSTTNGATTTATSTSYIFAGDTLVSYIEQALINGTATGTPSTFYVHPDHLGSTNVITGENGEIISSKDYLPYGSVRIDSGDASLARGYIGEFEEGNNLSYLNARFYQSDRGQFLSQDPMFWKLPPQLLSDPQQMNSGRTMGGSNSGFASGWRGNMQSRGGSISQAEYLADPQMQNSYAYARGNPIRFSDPTGLWYQEFLTGQQSWSSFYGEVGDAANTLGQTSPAWNFAMNHPYTTGAVVGVASAGAAQAGLYGTVALKAAAYPGVGIGYSASRVIQGTAYLYLAQDSLRGISSTLMQLNNLKNPTFGSSASLMYNAGLQGASTFGGERVGGIADTLNLLSSALRDLSKALSSISSQNSKK